MRGVILLGLLGACGFEHGSLSSDAARVDTPPDVILPTWQIDTSSKKAVPAAQFEWDELLSKNGISRPAPSHLWLMQESSGGLVDSIGSITLGPLNGPTYGNVVAGWNQRGVATADSTINQGFLTNSIGNLDGTSYLLLLYVALSGPPAGNRSIAGIGGGADHRYVGVTSSPAFQANGNGGVTPISGSVNPQTTVHPIVLKIDATNATYRVYTDQERLDVTWVATGANGNLLIVGNATFGAAPARYLYGVLWSGTAAELSDAEVKKLLTALGWAVSGF